MDGGGAILPHSIEAEKSVLGSILISRSAMEQAAEKLKPSDFYLPTHEDIFGAMLELYSANRAVDTVTLTDLLDRHGKLKLLGGVAYLTELSLYTPSAANVKHYITIVEERSVLRRLVSAGGQISKEAMEGEGTLENILDQAERRIFDISMNKAEDTMIPVSRSLDEVRNLIDKLVMLKGGLSGVPTGFTDLDRETSGLQPSDLIIIAGRPSMGKTAFALNIAEYAALEAKKSVVVFSLEMSRIQLIMRLASGRSGVSMQDIRRGNIKDERLRDLMEALPIYQTSDFYIDDYAGASVMAIRSKCRRLKAQHGLDLVVIDYLQLMQSTGKNENRQQAVSDMSRSLKLLARELEVPVVVLSQLGRGPELRSDHRPMMADLRESGAIEQDADVIMLLYREAVYNKEADNETEVIIAKHRNGPTGVVRLAWNKEAMGFKSLTDASAPF